jgi:hypothetical protein
MKLGVSRKLYLHWLLSKQLLEDSLSQKEAEVIAEILVEIRRSLHEGVRRELDS